MSSMKCNVRIIGAFAALATLALAISCRGFFVNPTLTSLAIGPSNLALAPDQTFQMVATGTYNDGSTRDVTGKSTWTSTSPNVANFTAAGLLKAASLTQLQNANISFPGQTTVSASFGSVTSSTQTVTVCPVVQSMQLKVGGGTSATVQAGQAVQFSVQATFNNVSGTEDVTSKVTWNISNTSILPSIDTTGSGTTTASTPGTVTITATLCGTQSNVVTVTSQ